MNAAPPAPVATRIRVMTRRARCRSLRIKQMTCGDGSPQACKQHGTVTTTIDASVVLPIRLHQTRVTITTIIIPTTTLATISSNITMIIITVRIIVITTTILYGLHAHSLCSAPLLLAVATKVLLTPMVASAGTLHAAPQLPTAPVVVRHRTTLSARAMAERTTMPASQSAVGEMCGSKEPVTDGSSRYIESVLWLLIFLCFYGLLRLLLNECCNVSCQLRKPCV